MALDVFYHDIDSYLRIVDYCSYFFEIDPLKMEMIAEVPNKPQAEFAQNVILIPVISHDGLLLCSK